MRPSRLYMFLLASSCTATGKGPLPEPGEVTYVEPAGDGEVIEWSIEDQVDEGPHIFKKDRIHSIALELPSDSVDSLYRDPYEYVVADALIDGAELVEVGVRLRGKIGSFRTLDGKPKFKLDFNAFVDGRRYQGLESLSLNNSVVDCSYLKEALSYRVFEELGVPAGRTSYAEVTVNGLEYGLYVIVETQDDRYVDARWEEPDGNLYDGKYIWYGDRSYQLLDFGDNLDDMYQLEEGTDVGNADITAVSDALIAAWDQPDFYEQMGEVIDWEEVHLEWAGEQWVGQNDGYCINKNNYRVYFDPSDGRAEIIPWDLDYSLLHDYDWGRSWSTPYGNLAAGCWQDSVCAAAQREAIADTIDIVEAMDLQGFVDDIAELTEAEALADPRRECGRGEISPWRDYVDGWVGSRSGELATRWGL